MKILHILNGQGTAGGFARSGVSGDILVWNEVLCEGPLPRTLDEAGLAQRPAFIDQNIKDFMPENNSTYEEIVLSEARKFADLSAYDEIVFWFDFDFFCQINMAACIAEAVRKKPAECRLSLVCLESFPGIEIYCGLGQLQPADFPGLFADRKLIPEPEARRVAADYDRRAAGFSADSDFSEEHFPYLKKAWQLFDIENDSHKISHSESQILKLISEEKEITFAQLFRRFSEQNPDIGYGDLQFIRRLLRLIPDKISCRPAPEPPFYGREFWTLPRLLKINKKD